MGCTVDVGSGMRARRSGHMTQAIRQADALEAQLARKRADHRLQFASSAPTGPIAWALSLTFSRHVPDHARTGAERPSFEGCVGGHGPQSPRRFGARPSLQPINLPDGPRAVSAT